MSSTVPEEILDHIIGLVAPGELQDSIEDFLSICLANKALLSISQSYLYRDIAIFPNTIDPYLEGNAEYEKARTRTQLLVRTLLYQPSLMAFAQKLTIQVATEPKIGDQFVAHVASTFWHVNRIRDLRIVFKSLDKPGRRVTMDFGLIESAFGRDALAALVSSPLLERITFYKIVNCPFYMVPLTPMLRHINLAGATLDADSSR
jgi:hypothetical protein